MVVAVLAMTPRRPAAEPCRLLSKLPFARARSPAVSPSASGVLGIVVAAASAWACVWVCVCVCPNLWDWDGEQEKKEKNRTPGKHGVRPKKSTQPPIKNP